ncbi:hypothetical protein [Dietzia massiliensis]|uniref:hypothetical protein n=1 Tax=Dietzia massiliensis TaxID=2697499 RepID=UPI001BD03060|nr:hypothetical protein [Dietzia massiliensis]MBS7549432.1 hypothetical protein [Dietzia massiliensis]
MNWVAGPFSEFWRDFAAGSMEFMPGPFGSAAIDGLVRLPSYVLQTLQGGAAIFGS